MDILLVYQLGQAEQELIDAYWGVQDLATYTGD